MIKHFNFMILFSWLFTFVMLPVSAFATGSDCNDPTVISSLPYLQTGLSTDGSGDNYSTSPCDDNFIDGNDYIFVYTPAVDDYVTIILNNVDAWTGLHLLDACPDVATSCVGSDLQSNPGSRIIEDVLMEGGKTYFIIVSTFPSPQSTDFDISVMTGNPPPAGTDCGNPLIINDLPFAHLAQNTADYGNDYSGTGPCFTNNYLNGNDIIYSYTPAANESVSVEVSNISGFFTGLQLLNDCLNAAPLCVASAYNEVTTENLLLENIYLEEGITYFLVISTWENPQSVTYDLRISSNRNCEKPIDLEINELKDTSAILSWTASSALFDVAVVPTGSDPNGSIEELEGNTYLADGLIPENTYDFYVRSKCPAAKLMITGVFDGPLSGGNPKGVELYVVNDIADLSRFAIGSANNGEGSDGVEFSFPPVAVSAGTFIYWTSDAALFTDFFGITADFEDTDALINGNDAVELFEDNVVIDAFGEILIDGTGQSWEYKDGWAYRKSGQENNNGFFDASKWNYSGLDQLEGGPTNLSCDRPFPIAAFEALPTLTSSWAGPLSFTTKTVLPQCGDYFYDNGGASGNYAANSRDTVLICPDIAGYAVEVTFEEFDVQSASGDCTDEFFIHDGENTSANMISPPASAGAWCWNYFASPPSGSGNLKDKTIISTHNSGCLTFVFHSDDSVEGNGWKALVSCNPVENCISPADLQIVNVTENTASISFEALSENAQTADIAYGLAGVPPEDGELVENISSPFQISGLLPSTVYELYVRQQCGVFGISEWVGPQTFQTACSAEYGNDLINPIVVPSIPFSGQGSTKDCFTNNIGFQSADAYYKITTDDCTYALRFSTCNEFSDFDTYLRLLDKIGNEITTNDDAAPEQCNQTIDGLNRLSVLEILVEPATTYYLVLEGFGPKEGFYQLDIEQIDIPYISTNIITRNVSCYGASDGLVKVEVLTGSPPFQYVWNTGAKAENIDKLEAGDYSLTITDDCGFSVVEEVTVEEPDQIVILPLITNQSESGLADGGIELSITGGKAPYIFRWDNGEQTKNIGDLSAGNYCVTVTDRAGCTRDACFTVESGLVKVQAIDELLSLEILPNPTSTSTKLNLAFAQPFDVEVSVMNASGQLMHEFTDKNVQLKSYELNVEQYPAGVYFVQIRYANNSLSYKLLVRH